MKQNGFNLVELALVLAIIALLVGGLLKGMALIENAKLKRLANLHSEITLVVHTYQDRYRYLPGDDPDAAARWYADNSVYNGNGEGGIEGKFNSSTDADESRKAWGHLRAAGLVRGQATDLDNPRHPFGGIVGVSSELVPGWEMETYIGYTELPTEVFEQLKTRIATDTVVLKYYSSGAQDSSWNPCKPLPANAQSVDVIFTNQNPCN